MEKFKFSSALGEIYAAFGKALPNPAVVNAIYRRVERLPDDFMAYAVETLQDREDLPKNLGLHLLRTLWPEYLSRHPGLWARGEQYGCDNCRNLKPGNGFFFVWDTDGHEKLAKCACNTNPDFASWPALTRYSALKSGLLLTDPQMEAAAGRLSRPDNPWHGLLDGLRNGRAPQPAPRPEHLRALEEAEAW